MKLTYFADEHRFFLLQKQTKKPFFCTMIFIGSTGGIITPAVVGVVAEHAGIQMGMGVVVIVTVLLLATILLTLKVSDD